MKETTLAKILAAVCAVGLGSARARIENDDNHDGWSGWRE
jgi:hypothetical protein